MGQHALELRPGHPSGEDSREENASRRVSGEAEHGQHEGEREEAFAEFHWGHGVGAAEPGLPSAGERPTRSGRDQPATTRPYQVFRGSKTKSGKRRRGS